MATMSRITGVIEEGLVVLDFGKYQGKTVQEVAFLDEPFYEQLIENKEKGVYAIRRNPDKTFRLYLSPFFQIDC